MEKVWANAGDRLWCSAEMMELPKNYWLLCYLMLTLVTFDALSAEVIRVIPLPRSASDLVSSGAESGGADPQSQQLAESLQRTLSELGSDQKRAKPMPRQPSGSVRADGASAVTSQKDSFGIIRSESASAHFERKGVALDVRLRDIGTPRWLKGRSEAGKARTLLWPKLPAEGETVKADEQSARQFMRHYRDYLRLDSPDDEMRFESLGRDELGHRHVRFKQQHEGLPVWPADLIVHIDQTGNTMSASGAYVPTPRKIPARPVVDADRAAQITQTALGCDVEMSNPPELIVYAPGTGLTRLAWKIEAACSTHEQWLAVVDALNGKMLAAINQIKDAAEAGKGTDVLGVEKDLQVWQEGGRYYLADTSKPMFVASSQPPKAKNTRGAIIISDANHLPNSANPKTLPNTNQVYSFNADSGWLPDAVSAAVNLSKTYDYFLYRHGRNSFDGQGSNILGVVRLGLGFDNAFWATDSGSMYFGDASPYAGALDVVAHELTHGVTDYSAKLLYQGQSGALSEAFSDIFGEMVEAYVEGKNDWSVGTHLGAPLRRMDAPSSLNFALDQRYPTTMGEYVITGQDNGGVHLNSTIVSHAFYLLAAGLPNSIGLRDSERIFYRALTEYLTQNAQFLDARLACIQAAEDLFGAGSVTSQRVAEAFDQVEIYDGLPNTATSHPVSFTRKVDSSIFVYKDTLGAYVLGRREPVLGDDDKGILLSESNVAPIRPAVTANGNLVVFVSEAHDACLVKTLEPRKSERCLGFRGMVHSVAMSPGGDFFAFVMLDENGAPKNSITLVDISRKRPLAQQLDLVAPASEGTDIQSVTQADVMTFTGNGRFLIYDALNVIRQDGVELGAWSIYAIDLINRQTLIVVPPVLGKDIGDPAVGKTSDDFLVFESKDSASNHGAIFTNQNSTGETVKVLDTPDWSFPVYAGDDLSIVFTSHDGLVQTGSNLAIQPLADDRLHAQGSPSSWLNDAAVGEIYRRGARYKLDLRAIGGGSGRVVSSPQGIDCGVSCKYFYPEGTRVTLTANPEFGSIFVGWRGSCRGRGSCIVNMRKARSAKAVFRVWAAAK